MIVLVLDDKSIGGKVFTKTINEYKANLKDAVEGDSSAFEGQTVFVTAVVTQPLRYIAVDRETLRPLLFEDGLLSDLLLSTFIARRELLERVPGIGRSPPFPSPSSSNPLPAS